MPEKFYDFWHAVMENCGCKDLEAFRQLPAEKLFSVWQNLKKSFKGAGQATFPVIDGRFVVDNGSNLLAAGKQKKIHYMAGTTSEDMMPPILLQMAKSWCENQEKKSYTWFFNRRLPGDENGAWHSSDLWYWFGTLANCWRPMEPKDYELSEQMVSYLCNFVKTGNPNKGGELPTWIASDKTQKRVLCFGEKPTHMGKASMLKLVKTLLTNKAVGE